MKPQIVDYMSERHALAASMQHRKRSAQVCLSIATRWTAIFALPFWVGCSSILSAPPVPKQSSLRPVQTAPGSATLEIFHVRVPTNEPIITKEIWQAVDEQRLDIEVRRELAHNGFRAGVLGGMVPDELARQLNLQATMPKMKPGRIISGKNVNPKVTRRVLQLNRHEPAIIQASEVQDEVVVMLSGAGGVRGDRYEEVEAVYSMRAEPVPGQRIQLRLTPELRHGMLKNRYSGNSDQGIFLMTPSRERETFDRLKINTELSAGEILIVSCQIESKGSLGHAFHAVDHQGPAEQKLILIRLLQIPGSEILADASSL